MDFFEGFLLGPIWSDTEYEARRHVGFYWFIGWIALLGYLFLLSRPGFMQPLLKVSPLIWLLVYVVMMVGLSFTGRYYYRLPVPLRILVLVLHLIKIGALYLMVYELILGQFAPELEALPPMLLEYVNATITRYTELFSRSSAGREAGMLVGLSVGGLLAVLAVVGTLIAASLIGTAVIGIAKLAQYLVDLGLQRTALGQIREKGEPA